MRRLWALLLFAMLAACGPPQDPSVPPDEDELPCQSDRDCEVHSADTATRRALCGSHSVGLGSASPKDDAACGPMPTMNANVSEPELACFRGTCVPIRTKH